MANDQERTVEFTDSPQIQPKMRKYDILRVPPNGTRNAVILSHYFAWTPLHYWRRRSTPCLGEGCEACEHGEAPRPKGYAAVAAKNKTKVWLLEVTENCAEAIVAEMELRTTLRGAVVNLSRLDQRANGKLTIEFAGKSIDATLIPAAPDVEEVLRRIWGFSKQGSMKVSNQKALVLAGTRCNVNGVEQTNGRS
ncbi:unnamed protein product [marine sediment metagenome]|uniref:Uncharacterized protein n=1 Tax=marine sediment metagenome TaxID=412755 RepID=X1DLL3_9ZZZZ